MEVYRRAGKDAMARGVYSRVKERSASLPHLPLHFRMIHSKNRARSKRQRPSPTLSPTDPVPRGLLTLCPGASSGPQGLYTAYIRYPLLLAVLRPHRRGRRSDAEMLLSLSSHGTCVACVKERHG
jgi:hypothetical protein